MVLKHYLEEFIYGGMDGVITTVAIVSGTMGANMPSNNALILGLSNVLADGFSMGVSRYNSLVDISDNKHRKKMDTLDALKSSLATFVFFVIMGCIPLLPFIIFANLVGEQLRQVLFIFASLAFITVGIVKGLYTNKFIKSFIEVVVIGFIGAFISYSVASLLKRN